MIWFVAWRNIWRNRTRSLIIMSAIVIGIFAGTFSAAVLKGMMEQRVQNVINLELSHIQIHNPEYLEIKEMHEYLKNVPEIASKLDTLSGVAAYSERVIVNSMIASAESGAGVQLFGIDPTKEKQVTTLHEQIVEGDYFADARRKSIVLGRKLAEKLNVKIGSRPVLTFQSIDGVLVYESFKVVGIYETVNSTYDEMHAFVLKSDLLSITHIDDNAAHEIAILLKNNDLTKPVKKKLIAAFPSSDIQSWTDLSPEMSVVTKGMEFSMYIFIGIILLALLFSIINTMLMVVLERTKEIGMLMSVGMSRLRVFFMILLESVYLSGFAGVIGIAIGYGTSMLTARSGIDLSGLYGQGLRSFGYDPVMYPDITPEMALHITIMVLITGIIASIVPARRALKLKPAEAIRTDM
ncbi:MAG: ABC transporter permease [Salinivirgaceae bacterium]|jgi:putative ABC transport system permease protein|nr:ABC transporter permease [Salinivirgaceae bacterium]